MTRLSTEFKPEADLRVTPARIARELHGSSFTFARGLDEKGKPKHVTYAGGSHDAWRCFKRTLGAPATIRGVIAGTHKGFRR